MCILIFKPAAKNIPVETLRTCFNNNADGAGFAYVNTDLAGVSRVKIKKAMTFEKFLLQYKRALKNAPESNFLIHFRISTGGVVSEYNNHPFSIKKGKLAFGHNGIIQKMNPKRVGKENDTRAFNRLILKNLPKGWERNAAVKSLIEEYVGWSKLITLDNKNRVVIFNEHSGYWVDGVWFSNTTYKPAYSYNVKNTHSNLGRTTPKTIETKEKKKNKWFSGNASLTGKFNIHECIYCNTWYESKDMFIVNFPGQKQEMCKDCKDDLVNRAFLRDGDFYSLNQEINVPALASVQ